MANGSTTENGDAANVDAAANGHTNNGDAEKSKSPPKIENGNVVRISTRQWVIDSNYDPKQIFAKLFGDDIKYLLSMDKLWAKRRPPVPLDWDNLPGQKTEDIDVGLIRDQQVEAKRYAFLINNLQGGSEYRTSKYRKHLKSEQIFVPIFRCSEHRIELDKKIPISWTILC